MNDDFQKNTISKYATVFVFALICVGALIAFGIYGYNVAYDLIRREELVEFNKGAMYMLGVGLSSGLLVTFMIHELIGKEISKSYNKKATRSALIFIGLIFVFPQIADYVILYKVKNAGYVFCENRSYRWLHAQNKVFAVDASTCETFRPMK